MYFIKWRADNVANNTNEAVTRWAIEEIKWADEQGHENLIMQLEINQQKYLKIGLEFVIEKNQTGKTYQEEDSRNGINMAWRKATSP